MTATTKGKEMPRESERSQFWREALERWEGSGLSKAAYCRQEGLSYGAFHWWAKELRRRQCRIDLESGALPQEESKPVFVPVTVSPSIPADTVESLEIVHPSGWRILVPDAVSEEALRRVLQAVASC